ncbi:MAG: hypothetical protein ACOC9S_03020 [Planctomycetota bacterium]
MTHQTPTTANVTNGSRRCRNTAAVLTLLGLVVSLSLTAASDGFYQDDDACHYLFARASWQDAGTALHWWARPGHNIPMMFAARLGGLPACRVLSAIMTALTAWLAWCIARRILGDTAAAAAAPLLVWVQPLVMTLSLTTLTETPAALYLALGTWLLLRGNVVLSATVWSLLFLTRLEALTLAPLFAGSFVWQMRVSVRGSLGGALKSPRLWAAAGLLLWAPVVYALAAAMVDVPPEGDPLLIFLRSYDTQYGTGALYHYPAVWPMAAGFGVLVAAVVGMFHLQRRALFVTAVVLSLLALHVVLFRFGLFATGGYARFMVPAAGLLAVPAAGGLRALWSATRGKTASAASALFGAWLVLSGIVAAGHGGIRVEWAFIVAAPFAAFALLAVARDYTAGRVGRVFAGVLVVLMVLQAGIQVRPLRLSDSPMHRLIARAVRAAENSPHAGNTMLTQHAVAHYLASNTAPAYSIADCVEKWRQARDGTLLLWESKYCRKPWEPRGSRLLRDELDRLGDMIYHDSTNGKMVMVYVKGPRTPPAQVPRGPTTRPAGDAAY